MPTYEFTVALDRAPEAQDFDLIFEAGLDDSTPEIREGRGVLNIARDADTLSTAIVSAVENVERAGFRVVGIDTEDLVSLKTIARRLDRTYESVRLLASGKRGAGAFPAPLSGDGWALYSWAGVSAWFSSKYGAAVSVSEDERVIAAADHLLRARTLLSAPMMEGLAALTARA